MYAYLILFSPWKLFKENYEKGSKSHKSSCSSKKSGFSRSKSLLNLNIKSDQITELKEKPISELDLESDEESGKNYYSDDELFASIANMSKKWEVDNKPKFSDFSKNLKNELKVIKVKLK